MPSPTRANPHHWVENGGNIDENGVYTTGDMYLHKGGLNAAWAAAQGARSGEKASQEVIDHLQAHRKAIGADTKAEANALIEDAMKRKARFDDLHGGIRT